MDDDRERIPPQGDATRRGIARNSLMPNMPEVLDDLDRQIVVALQSDGRASWRAIAKIVGTSTATVARRGQQLIDSGTVKVTGVPALSSTGEIASFLIRINCVPGAQFQVGAKLVDNPDVRFITIVTGRYDIIAELAVKGGATHYAKLFADLQSIEGIERWRSDLLMHVYKVTFDWGQQLFGEAVPLPVLPRIEDERASGEAKACSPDHLDELDGRIVESLRENGRKTFQAIADELGTNESSVRRRFGQLRVNGCIDVYTLVAAQALGMGAETLLIVKVDPRNTEDVAHKLAQYRAVRYLAATLDDNSLFCEVILPSVSDLYGFIMSTLSQMDGVQGWSASMELLFLKRGFVETPWWRTQAAVAAMDV